jgi:hypothetical protein
MYHSSKPFDHYLNYVYTSDYLLRRQPIQQIAHAYEFPNLCIHLVEAHAFQTSVRPQFGWQAHKPSPADQSIQPDSPHTDKDLAHRQPDRILANK